MRKIFKFKKNGDFMSFRDFVTKTDFVITKPVSKT